MTKQDFERNKPYTNINTEVKKRMKEETPRTNFLAKGKLSMLRKHLHKKKILKELKDRPDHLSPAKVKSD